MIFAKLFGLVLSPYRFCTFFILRREVFYDFALELLCTCTVHTRRYFVREDLCFILCQYSEEEDEAQDIMSLVHILYCIHTIRVYTFLYLHI